MGLLANNFLHLLRVWPLLGGALLVACDRTPSVIRVDGAVQGSVKREKAASVLGYPRRGRRVAPEFSARPRFTPVAKRKVGIRCMPDGALAEWGHPRWIAASPVAGAKRWRGKSDLDVRMAMISDHRGLCLAIEARDDVHRPAPHAAAFGRSDHVLVELWAVPGGRRNKEIPKNDSLIAAAVGVRFRLGTRRRLIAFSRPAEAWREKSTGVEAIDIEGGYRVEARLPLSALTPLLAPEVARVRYRVTIFDADSGDKTSEATRRFEGVETLAAPMTVPEAVQRRLSIRVCIAGEARAMWGYRNGWRCVLPVVDHRLSNDDRQVEPGWRFAFGRFPDPPRLTWLRERMVFVNLLGAGRSLAALVDRYHAINSLLSLGVVGAAEPGNARTKHSDAVPLKLPDGTWAVAVTHAYRQTSPIAGGRCAAGQKVYLSIIAARGAPESTPHNPPPDPDPPAFLEEVFRTLLEDCQGAKMFDWDLSRDRRMIQVRDALSPSRGVKTFVYKDGRYQPAGD